jgi:antitoxin CcdA
MDSDLFDPRARRRTVSLTMNGDLLEKAKAAGINISRTAETAVAEALRERQREQLRADIAQDFRAMEEYVDKHGNPAKEWRELFGGPDFDAA